MKLFLRDSEENNSCARFYDCHFITLCLDGQSEDIAAAREVPRSELLHGFYRKV
jgi:hypothetical protein